MKQTIRIATRQSPLALWQAEHVAELLTRAHPDIEVTLVTMTTKGDQLLDSPLAKIGGKGLFIKELEHALLNHQADIAVHSMKDVPVEMPEGLVLSTVIERDDPHDAFVSNQYQSLDELPQGAVLGTSSLRRQSQLLARYPHITVKFLRGNVNSRLAKLDAGEYDAIILAGVGLKRLGMSERIAQSIPTEMCLPAVGQGVIGIECRDDDDVIQALLAPLDHTRTRSVLTAERAMNKHLNGGCQVPIAGYATEYENVVSLKGLVGSEQGEQLITAEGSAPAHQAESLGIEIAQRLLDKGADKILKHLYEQNGG